LTVEYWQSMGSTGPTYNLSNRNNSSTIYLIGIISAQSPIKLSKDSKSHRLFLCPSQTTGIECWRVPLVGVFLVPSFSLLDTVCKKNPRTDDLYPLWLICSCASTRRSKQPPYSPPHLPTDNTPTSYLALSTPRHLQRHHIAKASTTA
jgi:hypothetical protein